MHDPITPVNAATAPPRANFHEPPRGCAVRPGARRSPARQPHSLNAQLTALGIRPDAPRLRLRDGRVAVSLCSHVRIVLNGTGIERIIHAHGSAS